MAQSVLVFKHFPIRNTLGDLKNNDLLVNYVNHLLNTKSRNHIHIHMKRQKQSAKPRFTTSRIITIGAIAAIVSIAGFFGYRALVPANGSAPMLSFPMNDYIKATHSQNGGFFYVSQASGAVKGIKSTTSSTSQINPSYSFTKGELVSMHFINEDYETHSQHNFNIDEFNVHTKSLGYFGTETVNFVADKPGTYPYYCSIHPEMKGTITVEG